MKCKYTIYNKNIYARPLAFLCPYLHKNTTKSLALGQPASISVFIQHIKRWNLAKRKEATGECFFFVFPLSLDWLAVVMVVLAVCSAVCCPAVPSSTKYHPNKIGHRMRGSFGRQFQNKKPFQIELSRTKIFKKIQLCSNRLDSTFKIQ